VALTSKSHPEAKFCACCELCRGSHSRDRVGLHTKDVWSRVLLFPTQMLKHNHEKSRRQDQLANGLDKDCDRVPRWKFFAEVVEEERILADREISLNTDYLPDFVTPWFSSFELSATNHDR
jgi:hypothetical protein